MMKKISPPWPNWLKDYHTEFPNIHKRIINPRHHGYDLWISLALTCPPFFEAYAVILHPFWINYSAREMEEKGIERKDIALKDHDFSRISWKATFKQNGFDFSLDTAYPTLNKLSNDWMALPDGLPFYYILPGEGECETEELRHIFKAISKAGTNSAINYFYSLLRSAKFKNDLLYRGTLADFENLPKEKEVWGNPSSIYPNDKSWYIGSNFDSPFTFIGGSKDLISSIFEDNPYEIFQLEYLIKPI